MDGSGEGKQNGYLALGNGITTVDKRHVRGCERKFPQGALKCEGIHKKDQFMFTPTATISDVVYLQLYRNLRQRGGGVLCMCRLSNCLSNGSNCFFF